MTLCLVFFVGLPIFIIRAFCRFENGKLCLSHDNSKKIGLVLLVYAFVWFLLRFFSDEWRTPHCGGFTWLAVFLFPVLLSIGLQLFFRSVLVVSLFQLLGIVLLIGCLI